jgi:hypothetical protein
MNTVKYSSTQRSRRFLLFRFPYICNLSFEIVVRSRISGDRSCNLGCILRIISSLDPIVLYAALLEPMDIRISQCYILCIKHPREALARMLGKSLSARSEILFNAGCLVFSVNALNCPSQSLIRVWPLIGMHRLVSLSSTAFQTSSEHQKIS